jgi:chaperone required for assembly of F1-ATPase
MTAPSTTHPGPAPRPEFKPEPLPEGGWGLTVLGRRVKTPARRPLVLPTQALAELAAANDGSELPPGRRLAFTAIDRVSDTREAVAEEVAKFAGSDLLCYFADTPEALAEREEALWGPWLDWAKAELGVELKRTRGISHAPQPAEALERIRAAALELDDFSLTGLAAATPLFGSAVLAFALQRGALSGEAAFQLSRLDEAFQQERWGVDAEAAERTAALAAEARLLERWLEACRTD